MSGLLFGKSTQKRRSQTYMKRYLLQVPARQDPYIQERHEPWGKEVKGTPHCPVHLLYGWGEEAICQLWVPHSLKPGQEARLARGNPPNCWCLVWCHCKHHQKLLVSQQTWAQIRGAAYCSCMVFACGWGEICCSVYFCGLGGRADAINRVLGRGGCHQQCVEDLFGSSPRVGRRGRRVATTSNMQGDTWSLNLLKRGLLTKNFDFMKALQFK